MANRSVPAVSRSDDLTTRYDPTSRYREGIWSRDPNNSRIEQRIANRYNTGVGLIDSVERLSQQGEEAYTGLLGQVIKDYSNNHDLATRVALVYEEAYPEAPFDIRQPLGDILSDAANNYRSLLETTGTAINDIIEERGRLEPDERPWWVKAAFPVPQE
jgi:hypothetical protein